MTIMLTGGAGFIGSHMAAYLMQNHIDFIVVDNLSNSTLSNIEALNKHFKKNIVFEYSDIRDKENMRNIFNRHEIDSIVHFASLKSVSDSFINQELYEDNNVTGSKILFDLLKEFKIRKFIFSSSACVYGLPESLPINETHPLRAINPYGKNKIDIESLIQKDLYFHENCSTKILRYFNPVGAFHNGIIGEIPKGVPNNLMPYLLGVVNQVYPILNVFGGDYTTHDGTAIRDYIHIMDLIHAHYLALSSNENGVKIYNVGTGKGFSVMDIIKAFEKISNKKVPYEIKPRRNGDVAVCFADSSKIKNELGWSANHSIEKMCIDAFNFSQNIDNSF
jgi:UDP-glucose 4-epimerase